MQWKLGQIKSTLGKEPSTTLPTFKSGPTGPVTRTKESKTPLQVFQLMLTSAILDSIVTQTKLFAEQKKVDFPFCSEELLAFFGLNIGMGLLRLPQIRDYWSRSKVLSTPFFSSVMSRDRFLSILKFLHLNDSSLQKKHGEEGYDRLFKVRPLLEHMSAVFPLYYQPKQHLSIDEMMLGTRCRVSFLQYLPKKPTKWGIKIWVLSEAKTGYVFSLQVYTGAESDIDKKGVARRVVLDLLNGYQGKNHLLYVDNFYTSAELLLDLLDIGVYCTGTVCTDRKHFPKELVPSSKALPMGNYRFAVSERFSVTAAWWKDRRDVFMMSSLHKQATETVLKRPKGSKDKKEVPCPSMVVDYNQHMGGVDLTDQHISYYSMSGRKTLKWWKKVLWRLLDIAIINSWIIYRSNYPDSSINSQKLFRLKLVEEMAQPLLTLRSSPTCPTYLHGKGRLTTAEDTRLMGKHFPYISAERKRCLVCSKKLSPTTGKRNDKKTKNYCPTCNKFLCLGKCFEIYHTQAEF